MHLFCVNVLPLLPPYVLFNLNTRKSVVSEYISTVIMNVGGQIAETEAPSPLL